MYSISELLENTLLVNFSNYYHYYLQHFSNRSVCSWYGSQSIPQTYQRTPNNEALKGVLLVLEDKMLLRY